MDPQPTSPLRRLCLALTGGEHGCPRKRFFISFLLAIIAADCINRVYIPCYITCMATLHLNHPLGWLDAILGTLTAICLIPSTLASNVLTFVNPWTLFGIPSIPADALPQELNWLYALGFYLSVPLYIASNLVIFALAWRRLKDAGYNRWNLLAGLSLYGWIGLSFFVDLGWVGFYIVNLSSFWLLYLYCRPTRKTDDTTPTS